MDQPEEVHTCDEWDARDDIRRPTTERGEPRARGSCDDPEDRRGDRHTERERDCRRE